jgi:thioredoxin reductase (NADPH)
VHDVVIIGAGPAGLTAATYLGRFRRSAIVIDGGASRARWIPESHNIPGFPQGISGTRLLTQLHSQAERFGAVVRPGKVTSLQETSDGFAIQLREGTLFSRYVLLATGVLDHFPNLDGATEAVLRSLLRVCPICDGFEATGKTIAVIGDGKRGEREADFLKTYSDHVTLLHVGPDNDPAQRARVEANNVELIYTSLACLSIEASEFRLHSPRGNSRTFDVSYSALGCTPQISLASALGAARDDSGALTVDSHQQTSIAGLYAAGDIVRGLNQVTVAAAEAAIASTDIHNRLRRS